MYYADKMILAAAKTLDDKNEDLHWSKTKVDEV